MANAQQSKSLTSNFSASEVDELISGLERATDRLEYTKGRTNPTINDQIELKIVKIINDIGIRYIGEGEKEKKHRATLSSRRKTLFDTPLLREIAKAQNVNGVTPGNLLREKLS
eukprot:12092772-Ditylum_brightwellii.AAC.1